MVTVGMNYSVVPGKEETFEKAFRAVLNVMKAMPGHSHSHLYRDVDLPGSYLIISEWNDQSAFDAFVRSEQFAKVTTWGKEQILTERPKHQIFPHAN
jgi:heme-degrading monooxygenase HmoA